MPRPTVPQLLYGSATVICSTLAMLLLSRTSSGPGVAVIAVSALALGLLVALSVPSRRPSAAAAAQAGQAGSAGSAERVPAQRIAQPVRAHTSSRSVREREPAGP
ncbi:hypothetical protein [Streptomyces sp. NPDC016845]|uniref:hypothetical protein n=1 Tax=Streptomyces sp. NPDC016845 TaxID=3364972 RepID=UPI0037B0EEC2